MSPAETLRRRALPAAVAGSAVLALAFRVVVLLQLRAHPEFLQPILDGTAHLAWAEGLLAGTWPGEEPFFRAPGYVAVLAGLLRALGGAAEAASGQLLLGAGTAALGAALGGRLAGAAGAWTAGVGVALLPSLAFFDFQFLAPFAAVPLTLGAVLATLAADRRPTAGLVLTAGLLWGAAVVVRPPLVAGALLLPAALVLRPTRFARLAGLGAMAVLVLPVAVSLHNVRVGDAAFIATQGGLNFYLGNGRDADGYAATFPDAPTALGYRMLEAAAGIAESDQGRELRATEVSRFWSARARADIAADPPRWLGLLGKKAVLFASAREIPNNHDPVLVAQSLPALRLPGWGLWLPLAGAGVWLGRRRRDIRIVAGVVLAVAFGCVVFFVNARFRVPAAPLLVGLGAFGLAELVRRVHVGQLRSALPAVGVAGLLALLAWTNPFGLPREPWPMSYLLVAEAERDRGEPVRSLRWVERALAEEPGLYPAWIAKLELLRSMERLPEAETLADRALAARPGDPALLTEKAILTDLRGRSDEALEWIDRAIAADPANPELRIHRAVMLARAGRVDEGRTVLEGILRERPGTPGAARAARILGTLESLAGGG